MFQGNSMESRLFCLIHNGNTQICIDFNDYMKFGDSPYSPVEVT